MTVSNPRDHEQWRRVISLSLLGCFVPYIALIAMTLARTGGVFEYALDDVYIHLAMAEGIANGGYGVNDGEYASASSSILYSYLMVPFSGTDLHVWWPLVVGFVGLLASAILWARVLVIAIEESEGRALVPVLALAVLGPMFLHHPAMALIGMEHMLHITAALLVLNGLLDFAREGRVGWLLVLGIILNPVLRFEGMSLVILPCLILVFSGAWRAGITLFVAAMVPVLLHFWHMSSLGLDMLPNSVNAKAAVVGGGADVIAGAEENNRLQTVWHSWLLAFASPSGRMLMVAIAALSVCLLTFRSQLRGVWQLIGWTAVLASLGQLLLGSVAAFFRYEIYIWTFTAGTGLVLLSKIRFSRPSRQTFSYALFVLAVIYGGLHYPVTAFHRVPGGGAAIFAQQRQMGLFVDNHWQAPIAVNDLGHVAYDNPYYVLDLWGLASSEALAARSSRADPLWADKLAERYEVRAAMVYQHWMKAHIPDHWIAVAQLKLTIPLATLGGNIVTIYAITADAEPELRATLTAFEPELPASAELIFMNTAEGDS